MKPIPLADLRHAVMGKVEAKLPAAAPPVRCVCTDTRAMKPDSVFVALRGERFDAHDHLDAAWAGGAAVAIVERPPASVPVGKFVIEVPDSRKALGRLANYVRQQMRHAKVIAVAGSNGKTGTKGLIHAALSGRLTGKASPASFNNDVGVPLTLFDVAGGDEYVVVEIGTNHPGEVANLSRIALPDLAVITGAGEEHLEFLRDLDGVRMENSQVAAGMDKARGLVIVHGDDADLVRAVGQWWNGRVLTFGLGEQNDLWAADVTTGPGGTRQEVTVPQIGRHVATNALAAMAVARRLGVPDDVVLSGLAGCHGPPLRMQPAVLGDTRLILDCYNSNPASLRAALDTLSELPTKGRRVAVLGDMFELGNTAPAHHAAAGRRAAEVADAAIFIGPLMAEHAAQACDLPADAVRVFDAPAACDLPALLQPDDLVLIKGSRGMALERLIESRPA